MTPLSHPRVPSSQSAPQTSAHDEHHRLAAAVRWIEEFLTGHHPDLGRDGAVCPYTATSLRRGLMRVVSYDASAGDSAFLDVVRRLLDELRGAASLLGDEAIYSASVVVPFGVADPVILGQIERVQVALKPECVSQGVMIGEFWPGHAMPGLHNRAFRPLATPVPMLAMRHMVLSDLSFLAAPHIGPLQQISYLASYERAMGARLIGRWRTRWAEALSSAHAAARRAQADPSRPCPTT